jgi:D-arabinonate dehydratase
MPIRILIWLEGIEQLFIKEVRTTHLRAPWIEVPKFGPSVPESREILVVEVETSSGVIGMGYLMLLGGGVMTIRACLEELVIPNIIGRNATDIEGIWQELWKKNYWVGRMGVTVMAQSAIDIALWDALGKKVEMPLHRLWGHCNDRISAYGSGCWRGYGPDGMVERAKRYVSQGFKSIKMQCGILYDRHEDVKNVAMMRDALGPEIDIMIDVNMGWTADEAIIIGRKFQEHDLFWLEEPVVCEDFAGYARIADALDVRVVGGETHFTRFDMRPFFEHPKLPILQPDIMRGGFTELRKIATVADTWGMKMAPHLFPELMVQLMASIPNPLIIEYVNWMDDAWVDPVLPVDGYYSAPERPGHGLNFKPEFISEYRV